MGIERARVVEVHAPTSATGRAGSGYLISDRLVLTSNRLVGRQGSTDVRPVNMGRWLPASVVWSAPAGHAVVLEVEDPSAPLVSPNPIRWGRIGGSRPVPVVAMGFPPADGRPEWVRDPVQFVGQLSPAGDPLRAVTPAGDAPEGGGMSGAALFAGAELVGVLVGDSGLHAVPAACLADDEPFVELVGGGRGLALTPVSTPSFGFPMLPANRKLR